MNGNKLQEALAQAYRAVVSKTLKLKALGITPDMSEEDIDALIETLAKAKAEKVGGDWTKQVTGQRFYITDPERGLIAFSAMSAQQRIDYEYADAFPDVADEDTMLSELEALMAD